MIGSPNELDIGWTLFSFAVLIAYVWVLSR